MSRADASQLEPEASALAPRPPHTRPWFWAAVAALTVLVLVGHRLAHPPPAPLPVLWQIPEWRLTDQFGRPYGSAELRGRVYIANFVFTSCAASCPRLSSEMARLQSRLGALGQRVHLLSVSVDPVADTPPRLREYAARYHADPSLWSFVTGPEDVVTRAVDQGFRVGVQRPPRRADGSFDPVALAHSNRFALVDARGRLRGSYDADAEGMAKILDDAAVLADER